MREASFARESASKLAHSKASFGRVYSQLQTIENK